MRQQEITGAVPNVGRLGRWPVVIWVAQKVYDLTWVHGDQSEGAVDALMVHTAPGLPVAEQTVDSVLAKLGRQDALLKRRAVKHAGSYW